MANLLQKDTHTAYAPGSPGVAASAGSPARAAYTSYEPRTVCAYVVTGGKYQWVLDANGVYQYVLIAEPGRTFASASYQCTVQQVPVYHPAQPAVPPTPGVAPTLAQTAYDYNLGWNAGARSESFFGADGYIQFKAASAVSGLVAGLNDVDSDVGYLNINHAFYLTHGVARVLENGVEKAYLGTYADGATFRIERRLGVATYYIGGVLKYTSTTPGSGPAFFDVSLYSGGDNLYDPAIGSYSLGVSAVSFPAPMTLAADTVGYAQSAASFRPMTVTSGPLSNASVSFPAMATSSADRAYGASAVSLPPMRAASSFGTLVPSYAVASAIMVPMSTASLMLSGGIGGASVVFPAMLALSANKVYGASAVSFPPMSVDVSAFEGNLNASMRELMLSTSLLSFFGKIDVELISALGVSTTLATLVLKDAAVAESANVSGTMSYSAIMQALMQIQVSAFAGIPVLTQDGEVWVVNDESGASSSYEGYGFNSFGKYRGKYVGVKADGVYLLEGDTDDGALIRSSISFGKQDFGTTAAKTVPNCYIGLASSGTVYLKVIADGTEYLYSTNRSSATLDVQRVKLGRGLRANYLTFELYNKDGADFELNSVEFEVASLSRRI